jgi:acyl transferase domain-containing protein
VSSFGFTGTNAHLVLEEGPVAKHDGSAEKERSAHLLTLTAVTADALKQMVGSYSSYLIQHPDLPIGDVCFTANTGRSTFDQRLAVTASSTEELAQKLKAVSDGHLPAGACRNDPVPGKHGALKLAFLYSDESTVYPGMGRELYESQPVFRETLNRCDSAMREEAGWSPLELLYGSPSAKRTGAYAHPVLYSMQYALSLLWKSWGVEPAAVMGYGLGEYAAAVCAGALRFEDGLKLVIRRARWIQSLPPGGGMSAVRQSEQRVREIIAPFGPEISIAAVNGPRHVVIAGKLERLRQAAVMLDKAGIRSKELDVPYALHSSEVAPILRQLAEEHSKIPFAKPQLDFVSGKTADVVRDAITPQYWTDEISSPVRFRDGMETLYRMGCTGFMEIGTRPMLVDMGRQCIQTDAHWFSTMRPGRTDWGELLRAAAELYAQGASINLSALDHGYVRRKVNLPTYPFQRQRHWFTSKAIQKKAPASERPGA